MALPAPHPGLVIGYTYLWFDEYQAGYDEGRKDRPCVIVLAVEKEGDEVVVTVAPITHSAPASPEDAIEIPSITKRRLGLDDDRSWVVVSEVNRFIWPGPDLRPVARSEPGRFAYGVLPPKLFARVKARLREAAVRQAMAVVTRISPDP